MNKQDDEEKGQILDELINKSEKIQTCTKPLLSFFNFY